MTFVATRRSGSPAPPARSSTTRRTSTANNSVERSPTPADPGTSSPKRSTDILDRNPTHPGATPLTAAIGGYQPTRSQFEDRLPTFCVDNDLPVPELNVIVNGYEVDAYYADPGLIIELDSWAYHQDRGNFESDRDRDAHQLAHGIPTIRITWERMTETPVEEAARIRQILDRLGARGTG